MIIVTDFDGTITREDVIDLILERFAAPEWLEVEALWRKGKMGSKECLARQLALVQAGAPELGELLDQVTLDPAFPSFLSLCLDNQIPFYIVSDNFRQFILRILHNRLGGLAARLDPGVIFSNEAEWKDSKLELAFPHSGGACTHGCAVCKAQLIARLKGDREVIFIGDGLSDRYAAPEADLVFGKRVLVDYCRSRGIEVIPFEDFGKIHQWLAQRLETARQGSVHERF